jgi:rubrerythrin
LTSAELIVQRTRLADLLTEAAEIEHNIMCQYLFAAFSMKRTVDEGVTYEQAELLRRWQATVLSIARQEMEHLGLVCNLLTAIGEAPNFHRQSFPARPRSYPAPILSRLEPFSLDAIHRWIRIEMPYPPDHAIAHLEQHAVDATDADVFRSIGQLYEEIERLFRKLDPQLQLFIGPPGAQITTSTILPVDVRGVQLPPNGSFYDVSLTQVTDLASARHVIEQIIEEGEGGGAVNVANSHFGRFVEMYRELRAALQHDPSFEPARAVVTNPKTHTSFDQSAHVTVLTNPAACNMSALFDRCYALTLLLLIRFFGQSDETSEELTGLQRVVFFPMMTTVIRPLGEMLTQLPAHPASAEMAGPSFDPGRRVEFLPHRDAAFRILLNELQAAAATAQELAASPDYPVDMQVRLTLMYENLMRMAIVLADYTGLEVSA